jgi:succinate dehydrogenase/fumarate reductase flavoprotein subunit
MTEPMSGLFGTGRGPRITDMPDFIARMVSRAEAAGATIRCDSAIDAIDRGESARVEAARLRTPAGYERIEADQIVLCTGGFPASTEMLERYVSPFADRLWLRSNERSTGDGIEAGLRAGASASRGMHAFYGHLLPAPPARVTPAAFIPLTQYYSVHCLVVNARGERFVDESEADEITAQALAREPEALGFIVLDAKLAAQVTAPAADGFPEVDRHAEIRRAGGIVIEAEDRGELAAGIDAAGGNGWRTLQALDDFNRLVGRHPERLAVPRSRARHTIDQPPFVAVPVRPAVTFTEGGLKIDESARVLDQAGLPIPGLYAAGADGGGIFHERYAGGLSLSLIFGRLAGEAAAAAALQARSRAHGARGKA